MGRDLDMLVALHKVMLSFDALKEKAERLPAQIEACKAEHQQIMDEHERVIQNVKKAQVALHDAEVDLKSGEETLIKKQTKLHDVKTNEEYKAALHEIEMTKDKNSEAETKILEYMDGVEAAKAEVVEDEKRLKQDSQEYQAKLKELEEELAAVQTQMNAFGPALETKRAEMPPKLVATFDRIYNRNGGVALAPVNSGFCGHCQINMPPHRIQSARQGRDITICECCGCILFWETEEEEEKVG